MKKYHINRINLLLFFILAIVFSSIGQENRRILKVKTYSSYSSGNIPSEIEYSVQDIKYDSVFREIYSVASGSRNPDVLFFETRFNDIAFSVIYGNLRYIFYNRAKFDSLVIKTGSIQGVRSIIAHELSHLLNNHPLRYTPSSHIFEKEADYYSGKILREFQSTLPESIEAILIYGNEETTKTHPSRDVRILEIKKGWISASFNIFQSQLVEFDSMIYQSAKIKLNSDSDLEIKLHNSFNNYISSRSHFINLIDSLEINEESVLLKSAVIDATEIPEFFHAFSPEFHAVSKEIPVTYESQVIQELIVSDGRKKSKNKTSKSNITFNPSGLIYDIPITIKDCVVYNTKLEKMGIVEVDSNGNKNKILLDRREYSINNLNEIIASFPDGSKSKVGIIYK